MAGDVIRHQLSFAIRFLDHFSGAPVPEELPVRLAGSFQRPAARRGSVSRRQVDGAYRFLSVPTGTAQVLWRDPFRRTQAGWARWDGEDPQVQLPRPDPTLPVEITLWPTAAATAPAGATGVRGKLLGSNADGLAVRIARTGTPFDRFTRTDSAGEFLFLPPGTLAPDGATGRVPLDIEVRDAAGVQRVVTGGAFLPAAAGPAFAGPSFTVAPRTVPRVLFQLA
ncbi:hypothetical protein ILP92_16990 [Maribius pontilimi]|uniref:Uncharacterized protein n=1 Tax=Palleronia pontilimi TaxID=1964209 RepID=A0A934MIP0_9RHOB|nr:hypothetical protein [Palleronia pontilimi]MBJ3764434.1 hypothetical protein [Palleronia pontilimi]